MFRLCAVDAVVVAATAAVSAVVVAVRAARGGGCGGAVNVVVCAVNAEQCFGAVRKCVWSICGADVYLCMYDTTCSIWVPFVCSASVWVVSSWWGIL